MENNNFSNENKNSPRDSWTAFFQKWMMKNPTFTSTFVLALIILIAFSIFRNYAIQLGAFLSTLAIGVAAILRAIKGKK